jgi:hypothetical protein
MDYDYQAGWVAPRPQYFDLEGLPCDGYGYTVVISGPLRKGSRLRRRRSISEGDAHQPVLQRPTPTLDSTGSKHVRLDSNQDKHIKLDIATVREVDVRHHANQEKYRSFGTQSSASDNIELGGTAQKTAKSWFADT